MELENLEMENIELENKENSERYVRKDIEGGFIYNKSEINYYRQVQKLEVANNLMLGDYNQNGVYTLNAELLDQLVNLTKVYQYSFGSNMFCQSLTEVENYGKIDFAIKIVKDQPTKGSTTAILELLEPIDKANGYYTNTNTVQISTYSAQETNTFVVDVLKKFNVISKKDTGLIAKRKDNIDLIIQRKKYEEMRKNLLEEKVEEVYKANFNKKLKLLSKSPVGKKIIDEFNLQSYKINGWFVKEGMKGYFKTVDELLQSIIDKNKAEVLQDVKLMASLNKLESDCAKMLNDTIIFVDKTLGNPEFYGANVVLLANNKNQLENQTNNQNSKTVVKEKSVYEKHVIEKVKPESQVKEEHTVKPERSKPEQKTTKPQVKTEQKSNQKQALSRFIQLDNAEEEALDKIKAEEASL